MPLVAPLLYAGLAFGQAEPPPRIQVVSVVVSAVEQVEVSAAEQGTLSSVKVEEGDVVEAGQVLASLDDGDAVLARERAEIERDAARAEAENSLRVQLAQKSLEVVTNDLNRVKRSRELFRNALTDEEVQHRQLAVDRAALELAQAEHDQKQAGARARLAENELAIAERNVQRRRVMAPIAGHIVKLTRRAGEWVEPGQPVLRIVRVDRLRAEGFIGAVDAHQVASGQKVTLAVELPGAGQRTLAGVLRFVSPEINPVDGRVRVWAELDNAGLQLRPGVRATMSIETAAPTTINPRPPERPGASRR